MKIALAGNQARAMRNFWAPLLSRIIHLGHEAVCLLPENPQDKSLAWEEELRGFGAKVIHYPLERKGLNPFQDLGSILALKKILAAEKPDRLLTYTIKPAIYGSLASALAGAPEKIHRHAMITGLGYAFEADSFTKRLLQRGVSLLYRLSLSRTGTVWFQNQSDRSLFENLSIIKTDTNALISQGTGIDTDYFAQTPEPEIGMTFLYVGRLLEAKGLRDLAKAAALVKKSYPEARILLLGPEEKGPGSIPLDEVLGWQKQGILEYLGEMRDVRPFLAQANVVVLPSWREGLPVSLLEAMSVGRALIATDVPGCREAVRHGENGLLVPDKNPAELAHAMLTLMENPDLRKKMAETGRKMCLESFDAAIVTDKILEHMLVLK